MCPVGHPAKRRHEITVNIELPSHKANTCWVIVTVENTFQMFFVGDEGRRARSAHSPFSMPELDGELVGTAAHLRTCRTVCATHNRNSNGPLIFDAVLTMLPLEWIYGLFPDDRSRNLKHQTSARNQEHPINRMRSKDVVEWVALQHAQF